jgi:TonB family protein
MSAPRTMAAHRSAAITLFCLSLWVGILAHRACAQESLYTPEDTTRGINLYRQGDTEKAIQVLSKVVASYEEDADAWYYLGLAYKARGLEGSARAPFEHVVALRPDFRDGLTNLAGLLILANQPERAAELARRAIEAGDQSDEAHYVLGEASLRLDKPDAALEEADKALKLKPDSLKVLILKGLAHQSLKQYEEAAESFNRLLALSPKNFDAETWRLQVEYLRRSAAITKEASTAKENSPPALPEAFKPREVTAKARIVRKPEPSYTEEARRAGLEGTVVLHAIFSFDGTVKNLYVSRWLPYGMTTESVRAAKGIKFTPATKDGQPVSQYIQIEYNYNLH